MSHQKGLVVAQLQAIAALRNKDPVPLEFSS